MQHGIACPQQYLAYLAACLHCPHHTQSLFLINVMVDGQLPKPLHTACIVPMHTGVFLHAGCFMQAQEHRFLVHPPFWCGTFTDSATTRQERKLLWTAQAQRGALPAFRFTLTASKPLQLMCSIAVAHTPPITTASNGFSVGAGGR